MDHVNQIAAAMDNYDINGAPLDMDGATVDNPAIEATTIEAPIEAEPQIIKIDAQLLRDLFQLAKVNQEAHLDAMVDHMVNKCLGEDCPPLSPLDIQELTAVATGGEQQALPAPGDDIAGMADGVDTGISMAGESMPQDFSSEVNQDNIDEIEEDVSDGMLVEDIQNIANAVESPVVLNEGYDVNFDYDVVDGDQEITLQVTAHYSPGEKETRVYPGSDPSVEITNVVDGQGINIDITQLAPEMIKDMETKAFEKVEYEADNAESLADYEHDRRIDNELTGDRV